MVFYKKSSKFALFTGKKQLFQGHSKCFCQKRGKVGKKYSMYQLKICGLKGAIHRYPLNWILSWFWIWDFIRNGGSNLE